MFLGRVLDVGLLSQSVNPYVVMDYLGLYQLMDIPQSEL